MSEPNVREKPPLWWRIARIVLPVLFLFTGFFGVQVWMVWDQNQTPTADQPVVLASESHNAKADVAKLSTGGSAQAADAEQPLDAEALPVKVASAEEQALSASYPGTVFYWLQAGSFSDPAGAEKLRKRLGELGYGAVTVKESDHNDVVIMAFFSRDQADSVCRRVTEDGVTAVVEKVSRPARMVLLNPGSERLQTFMDGALSEMPELLRELGDYSYLYESQGFSKEDHEKLVVRQLARLSDMKSAIANMTVDPDDKALQTQLTDFITDYIGYLEKIKRMTSLKRAELWPGFLRLTESLTTLNVEN